SSRVSGLLELSLSLESRPSSRSRLKTTRAKSLDRWPGQTYRSTQVWRQCLSPLLVVFELPIPCKNSGPLEKRSELLFLKWRKGGSHLNRLVQRCHGNDSSNHCRDRQIHCIAEALPRVDNL